MAYDPKVIERAARARKVLYLATVPGMDNVAVKLNSGLTYGEKENAEAWARAFAIAEQNPEVPLFELAALLRSER